MFVQWNYHVIMWYCFFLVWQQYASEDLKLYFFPFEDTQKKKKTQKMKMLLYCFLTIKYNIHKNIF